MQSPTAHTWTLNTDDYVRNSWEPDNNISFRGKQSQSPFVVTVCMALKEFAKLKPVFGHLDLVYLEMKFCPGMVFKSCILFLDLQTIHRFSQSRRRPLLITSGKNAWANNLHCLVVPRGRGRWRVARDDWRENNIM